MAVEAGEAGETDGVDGFGEVDAVAVADETTYEAGIVHEPDEGHSRSEGVARALVQEVTLLLHCYISRQVVAVVEVVVEVAHKVRVGDCKDAASQVEATEVVILRAPQLAKAPV